MLLARFCSALMSGVVLAVFSPSLTRVLWAFSPCASWWGEGCALELELYGRLDTAFRVLAACLWVAAWALLEVAALRRPWRGRQRLLAHLRYGPLAVLLFSFVAVAASDLMLIEYSRWQIVRYIHGDAPPQETPALKLHNDYRHWCGNGMAANEYALYGATPAAYFDDPDPAVRARALQASLYVYDWVNYPAGGPSIEVLRKALSDPDPLVRKIADEHRAELLDDHPRAP
jgi:hypothetical protein